MEGLLKGMQVNPFCRVYSRKHFQSIQHLLILPESSSIVSFLSSHILPTLSTKVGDTAVSAAQDRGHDALALQIARCRQFDDSSDGDDNDEDDDEDDD